jgi:hypothetical protein
VPSPVVAVIVAAKHPRNTSKHPYHRVFLHENLFVFSLSSGDYGLTHGGSNSNYPYNEGDNSPTSYDNKIHVSEIYGNSKLNRSMSFAELWNSIFRFGC